MSSGATGDRVKALNALLAAVGQATTPGSTFGKETQASLKLIQAWAGRSATGVADANTWAVLFMTPDKAPAPVLSGTPQVTQTLTASVAKWSPGTFSPRLPVVPRRRPDRWRHRAPATPCSPTTPAQR